MHNQKPSKYTSRQGTEKLDRPSASTRLPFCPFARSFNHRIPDRCESPPHHHLGLCPAMLSVFLSPPLLFCLSTLSSLPIPYFSQTVQLDCPFLIDSVCPFPSSCIASTLVPFSTLCLLHFPPFSSDFVLKSRNPSSSIAAGIVTRFLHKLLSSLPLCPRRSLPSLARRASLLSLVDPCSPHFIQ